MIEQLDDLTLCYMDGFKNGQESMKAEIERLRAALLQIAETPDHYTPHMVRTHARAALAGEASDDAAT